MTERPSGKKFNTGQKRFFLTWAIHFPLSWSFFLMFIVVNIFPGSKPFLGSLIDVAFVVLAFPLASPFLPTIRSDSMSGQIAIWVLLALAANGGLWASVVYLYWWLRRRGRSR